MGSYSNWSNYTPRLRLGLVRTVRTYVAAHALSYLVYVTIVLIWFPTASRAPTFLLCSVGGGKVYLVTIVKNS